MTEKKIAIYSRKSKYSKKGESIKNQIDTCKKYFAHQDNIREDNFVTYIDDGFSGGTINRPNFRRMMNDIEEGKLSSVIVYRLDRISRNVNDFSSLIIELDKHNVDFISVKEQFDTSTPVGRAMMYISSVFSQLERETISERIRDNMYDLSKTGRWLGGTTPYGYAAKRVESVNIDGKERSACYLEELPEELEYVKLMFNKYLEFASMCKLQRYLTQEGFRTRQGKIISVTTLRRILSNMVYAVTDKDMYQYLAKLGVDLIAEEDDFNGRRGIITYNKSSCENKTRLTINDESEWVVALGNHKGIVPGRVWIQVQKLLEANKTKSYRQNKSHDALLSGLLICGKCGAYMRPRKHRNFTKDGEQRFSYLCETKEHSRGSECNCKRVNGNILDKLVTEEIIKLVVNNNAYIQALKKARFAYAKENQSIVTNIKNAQREAAHLEDDINALVIFAAKVDGVTQRYTIKQIQQKNSELKELQNKLDELTEILEKNENTDIELNILAAEIDRLSRQAHGLSPGEKAAGLRKILKKIVWNESEVHVWIGALNYTADKPNCFYINSGDN